MFHSMNSLNNSIIFLEALYLFNTTVVIAYERTQINFIIKVTFLEEDPESSDLDK